VTAPEPAPTPAAVSDVNATSPRADLNDRAAIESFFDGVFDVGMKEHHVAGAAVAVVKDGQLLFTKGCGYQDIDRAIPVDPYKTLFRIGSTTKLFTWTSVMQLVEQGKLDLDEDVNAGDLRRAGSGAGDCHLQGVDRSPVSLLVTGRARRGRFQPLALAVERPRVAIRLTLESRRRRARPGQTSGVAVAGKRQVVAALAWTCANRSGDRSASRSAARQAAVLPMTTVTRALA
jgi:hypothetical protein